MANRKVSILLCDEHYPEAIEKFGYYTDALFNLFNQEFELQQSWNCYLGEFPNKQDELSADLWLISGSKYSVNDDDEWVSQLENLVAKLYQDDKQLFGICFGHQMIHKALGGKVEKRTDGFAVGLEKLFVKNQPHLPLAGEALLFMHQEEVTQLGTGFSSNAYSEHCDNVITTDSKGNLTLQCHPEFSIDFFALLCERVEFDNKQAIVEKCFQAQSKYRTERKSAIQMLNQYLLSSNKQ